MPERGDADLLEVGVGEFGEHFDVDVVVGKRSGRTGTGPVAAAIRRSCRSTCVARRYDPIRLPVSQAISKITRFALRLGQVRCGRSYRFPWRIRNMDPDPFSVRWFRILRFSVSKAPGQPVAPPAPMNLGCPAGGLNETVSGFQLADSLLSLRQQSNRERGGGVFDDAPKN